jgi:hypothetical protein
MEQESSLPCSQERATGPYLGQMHPVHNFSLYFPKIHSNIILPCTPRSSGWSLPFRFSNQNIVRIISSPPCVLHARPPHPLYLITLIIFGEASVIKLITMQSSPASCYFFPLRSKYFPQHPVPNTLNLCSLVRDTKFHIHTKLQVKIMELYT